MACNLSMINLSKFVVNENFDFNGLFKISYNVMGLMDNLIDVMDFPDDRFKEQVLKYRPVGIGPAGLSDTLFLLNLKYNGKDGRDFAAEAMRTMTHGCVRKSIELAEELGPFHNYEFHKTNIERIIKNLIYKEDDEEVKITLDMLKKFGVRNCQHTTCQPTGTTALSCDCSYGIEPCFGLVFEKNLITGGKMIFFNEIFKEKFKNESWFSQDLADKIWANGGSLKNLRGIPKEVKEVFIVAHDIKPKDRVDMQAVLQKHVSNAISSTVNLPKDTTLEEISDLYLYAYEQGLKGITIYRDGSKEDQPVSFSKEETEPGGDFKRPTKLPSLSYCVELEDDKLYVTVSTYNGRPVEVFLNMGKGGSQVNSLTEGLGRIISSYLKRNNPLEIVIKQLKNIKSDKVVWFRFEETDKKPAQLWSIPDAVAKVLDKYYFKKNSPLDLNENSIYQVCPKCKSSSLEMVEGCPVCRECGFSKCS
jgi:ribonucleoside-diphosphate reductase alpha chain